MTRVFAVAYRNTGEQGMDRSPIEESTSHGRDVSQSAGARIRTLLSMDVSVVARAWRVVTYIVVVPVMCVSSVWAVEWMQQVGRPECIADWIQVLVSCQILNLVLVATVMGLFSLFSVAPPISIKHVGRLLLIAEVALATITIGLLVYVVMTELSP
jgi:hypothetical protein